MVINRIINLNKSRSSNGANLDNAVTDRMWTNNGKNYSFAILVFTHQTHECRRPAVAQEKQPSPT